MLKALFIINPSSGHQNFLDNVERIVSRLVLEKIVNHIDVEYTRKKDDARNKARSLKPGDYDFVTAVGGDGTINEVIGGIVDGGSDIPVAILSAGTVNDFAGYLHLPVSAPEFCNMISYFRLKSVDVGRINDRVFMNVVAGGIATDIGYNVSKERKALLGKTAYYLECIKEVPRQLFKPFRLKIESEEYSAEDDFLLFMVMNTQSVGGYKDAAPLASVSDGVLDVLLLKKMDFKDVPELIMRILRGDHINSPSVKYYQTRHLTITPMDDKETSIDLDGEFFGTLPADIHVEQSAVNIVVPK